MSKKVAINTSQHTPQDNYLSLYFVSCHRQTARRTKISQVALTKVGRLLQRELSRSHNETGLEPDSGLPFCDTDEDSSDSGLEGLAVPSKTEMELDH